MLDDTLVVGQVNLEGLLAQGSNGRDHNFILPPGLLGVESTGVTVGATDEFGYKAVKTDMRFMTCMLPCYIYWVSSTRKVLFAWWADMRY